MRQPLIASTLVLMSALGVPGINAQTASVKPPPSAATAPTAVPALVPYAAIAERGDGSILTGERTLTFLIFKDESGGEPLWVESQPVSVDTFGHYQVQLGASSPSGLPMDLFASGEGRWLEVQIAGEKQRPRVLLTSVPYAMKAADAATLGGLPPSAFARVNSIGTSIAANPAASPDTSATVTTAGGTGKYLPVFNGTNSIANSEIIDTGTSVGIGNTPNSSVKLDIGGAMIVRGNTIVTRQGTASSTRGYPSYGFDFYSNVYNSSTKSAANPYFSLRSEPVGNNTATPSATFNLRYSGTGTEAETGLYINPNGTVHFAPGQTFPGGTGVSSVGLSAPSPDFTVSGSPVTSSGTLGFNWNVAPTSADTANAIVKRDSTGSFSAGAFTANLGMEGITNTSGGNGVAGLNTGTGTAIYGLGSQGVGVWGQSNGTGAVSDGVHGVTASGTGSGVAGVNNGGGIGVYGTGAVGVFGTGSDKGFVTDSNTAQARTAGGWVKAMAFVNAQDPPYTIERCFNSTLSGAAATTPPCGMRLQENVFGAFVVFFNFEVDDRFYLVTSSGSRAGVTLDATADGENGILTFILDKDGNYIATKYNLFIF
jgi:hypothetical protein